MNQTSVHKSVWPVRVFAAVASISVIGMFSLQATKMPIFDLRFNVFALLSFAAVVLNLAFFLFASRFRLKSEEAIWFTFEVGVMALFSVAEMLQRLSANPEAAAFWAQLQTITSGFNAVGFFLFALLYVNSRSKHVFTIATALITGCIIFFFGVGTELIFTTAPSSMKLFPWGWQNDVGDGFTFVAVWVLGLFITTVVMFTRFSRRAPNNVIGKQAKLFAFAIGIPIVGGLFTDVVLPTLGLNSSYSYQGIFLTSATCIMMYGLYRYRVFQVSPATLSQDIFDTMSEAVVVINKNKLGIEYLNNAAERLFHKSGGVTSVTSLFDILSNDYKDQITQALHDVSSKKSTQELDDIIFEYGGDKVYLRIAVAPLDESTGIDGYVLAISDVTELKHSYAQLQKEKESVDQKVRDRTRELAHTQARLLASIGSLQQGYIMTDSHFNVLTTNSAVRKILGISADKKILELDDLDIVLPPRKHLPDQIRFSFEHKKALIFSNAVKGNLFLDVFITPIVQADDVLGNVVIINDVTEANILQRSRDEFFSIASHELRTPLTTIRGNTSMILDFYKEKLEKEPDLQHMLVDIHDSSRGLIDIVNDFLDMSRLEQGKAVYRNKAFSVEQVIEKVIYEMKAVIQQKKINIKTDTKTLNSLPKVFADEDRAKQIIYNLIGNAVKFTEHGGVTISSSSSKTAVKITVEDTGRGISAEGKKLLFHKFQQAGESLLTRDTTRGTGLGLYISRILADNMGGSLKLESSEEGKGSVFSLSLPVATEQQLTTTETATTDPKVHIDAKTGLTVAAAE